MSTRSSPSGSGHVVEVSYRLSPALLRRVLGRQVRRQVAVAWLVLLLPLTGLCWWLLSRNGASGVGLAALLVMVWAAGAMLGWWLLVRAWTRRVSAILTEAAVLRAGEAGVQIERESSRSEWRWPLISRAQRAWDSIALLHGDSPMAIIPRDSLGVESEEKLINLLEARVGRVGSCSRSGLGRGDGW